MFVLDMTSLLALTGLLALRVGVPVLGLWVLSATLKRALPAQV